MKPEIKAMLPVLDVVRHTVRTVGEDEIVYLESEVLEWLDKLTEGAQVVYLNKDSIWCDSNCSDHDTHTALLICPREIKKQTPLEIAVESMKHIRDKSIDPLARKQAEWALAKIEAAK